MIAIYKSISELTRALVTRATQDGQRLDQKRAVLRQLHISFLFGGFYLLQQHQSLALARTTTTMAMW